jgi:UDP-N-acetyl-D-mannosaminuronate dehydrogenase
LIRRPFWLLRQPNGIFLPFKPGLVGGHCIGVDPYYLAQKPKIGYHPENYFNRKAIE